MDTLEKLEWDALEYDEKDRGQDWFWALGVVVVAGSIASILFENYFFAALVVISGVMLGFFAVKKPDMIHYEINKKGLKIRNNIYTFDSIKSFWVRTEPKENQINRPALLIHSQRFFLPVISVPIEMESADMIRAIMLEKEIPEEEMQEHISEHLMEVLGF